MAAWPPPFPPGRTLGGPTPSAVHPWRQPARPGIAALRYATLTGSIAGLSSLEQKCLLFRSSGLPIPLFPHGRASCRSLDRRSESRRSLSGKKFIERLSIPFALRLNPDSCCGGARAQKPCRTNDPHRLSRALSLERLRRHKICEKGIPRLCLRSRCKCLDTAFLETTAVRP